jgi:hypothetical protein
LTEAVWAGSVFQVRPELHQGSRSASATVVTLEEDPTHVMAAGHGEPAPYYLVADLAGRTPPHHPTGGSLQLPTDDARAQLGPAPWPRAWPLVRPMEGGRGSPIAASVSTKLPWRQRKAPPSSRVGARSWATPVEVIECL